MNDRSTSEEDNDDDGDKKGNFLEIDNNRRRRGRRPVKARSLNNVIDQTQLDNPLSHKHASLLRVNHHSLIIDRRIFDEMNELEAKHVTDLADNGLEREDETNFEPDLVVNYDSGTSFEEELQRIISMPTDEDFSGGEQHADKGSIIIPSYEPSTSLSKAQSGIAIDATPVNTQLSQEGVVPQDIEQEPTSELVHEIKYISTNSDVIEHQSSFDYLGEQQLGSILIDNLTKQHLEEQNHSPSRDNVDRQLNDSTLAQVGDDTELGEDREAQLHYDLQTIDCETLKDSRSDDENFEKQQCGKKNVFSNSSESKNDDDSQLYQNLRESELHTNYRNDENNQEMKPQTLNSRQSTDKETMESDNRQIQPEQLNNLTEETRLLDDANTEQKKDPPSQIIPNHDVIDGDEKNTKPKNQTNNNICCRKNHPTDEMREHQECNDLQDYKLAGTIEPVDLIDNETGEVQPDNELPAHANDDCGKQSNSDHLISDELPKIERGSCSEDLEKLSDHQRLSINTGEDKAEKQVNNDKKDAQTFDIAQSAGNRELIQPPRDNLQDISLRNSTSDQLATNNAQEQLVANDVQEQLVISDTQEHSVTCDTQQQLVDEGLYELQMANDIQEQVETKNLEEQEAVNDRKELQAADDVQEQHVPGDVQEQQVADDVQEQQAADDAHEQQVANDVQEQQVVDDVQEQQVADDAHEQHVANDVHEQQVADDGQEQQVADDAQKQQVADDAQEQQVADDAQEQQVADDAQEQKVADDAQEQQVVDDAQEQKVADDAQEQQVADDVQEQKVADDVQEQKVADDVQEQQVADNAQKQQVADDAQEQKVADDAQEQKVADDAQEQQVADDAQEQKVANHIQEQHLVNDVHEQQVTNNAQKQQVIINNAQKQLVGNNLQVVYDLTEQFVATDVQEQLVANDLEELLANDCTYVVNNETSERSMPNSEKEQSIEYIPDSMNTNNREVQQENLNNDDIKKKFTTNETQKELPSNNISQDELNTDTSQAQCNNALIENVISNDSQQEQHGNDMQQGQPSTDKLLEQSTYDIQQSLINTNIYEEHIFNDVHKHQVSDDSRQILNNNAKENQHQSETQTECINDDDREATKKLNNDKQVEYANNDSLGVCNNSRQERCMTNDRLEEELMSDNHENFTYRKDAEELYNDSNKKIYFKKELNSEGKVECIDNGKQKDLKNDDKEDNKDNNKHDEINIVSKAEHIEIDKQKLDNENKNEFIDIDELEEKLHIENVEEDLTKSKLDEREPYDNKQEELLYNHKDDMQEGVPNDKQAEHVNYDKQEHVNYDKQDEKFYTDKEKENVSRDWQDEESIYKEQEELANSDGQDEEANEGKQEHANNNSQDEEPNDDKHREQVHDNKQVTKDKLSDWISNKAAIEEQPLNNELKELAINDQNKVEKLAEEEVINNIDHKQQQDIRDAGNDSKQYIGYAVNDNKRENQNEDKMIGMRKEEPSIVCECQCNTDVASDKHCDLLEINRKKSIEHPPNTEEFNIDHKEKNDNIFTHVAVNDGSQSNNYIQHDEYNAAQHDVSQATGAGCDAEFDVAPITPADSGIIPDHDQQSAEDDETLPENDNLKDTSDTTLLIAAMELLMARDEATTDGQSELGRLSTAIVTREPSVIDNGLDQYITTDDDDMQQQNRGDDAASIMIHNRPLSEQYNSSNHDLQSVSDDVIYRKLSHDKVGVFAPKKIENDIEYNKLPSVSNTEKTVSTNDQFINKYNIQLAEVLPAAAQLRADELKHSIPSEEQNCLNHEIDEEDELNDNSSRLRQIEEQVMTEVHTLCEAISTLRQTRATMYLP